MSMKMTKKENRLTELLMALLNEPKLESNKLAKRFGVGRATIYRDVKLLNRMGLSITSNAGTQGGYRLSIDSLTEYKRVYESGSEDELRTKLSGIISQELDSLQNDFVNKAQELKALIDDYGMPVNDFIRLCEMINQYNALPVQSKEHLITELNRKEGAAV